MDENNNTAAVETEAADSWDSIDLSDVDMSGFGDDSGVETPEADTADHSGEAKEETDAGTEADTGATPAAEEASEQAENTAQTEPETFTLKVLGEERTVGKDEVITLAQKGADYDRLKDRNGEYEAFFKELAEDQGVDVKDVIDNTRAAIMARKEGIDQSIALEKVRLANERRQLEAERKQAQDSAASAKNASDAKAKRENDVKEFMSVYGDIKPADIPKEVWADVNKGMTLLTAYTKYENKELKAKLEAEKQNEKNKKRATGSQTSAGKTDTMSDIERLWREDE